MLPGNWKNYLTGFTDFNALAETEKKVAARREAGVVFPPEEAAYTALELTAPEDVRVVILGQDPYHDDGQAYGLAFDVPEGVKEPPSLRNIKKEFRNDLKREPGSLRTWAEHGVLLLNAVLTVDAHAPGSHAKLGWELFTDSVIRAVSARNERVVFILWGAYAIKKAVLADSSKHLIITSVHPSPLSASRGFFGSAPFSRTEAFFQGSWLWP
ncbi:MAG: uracil-DNA glycosylase [Lentisphaeria bacterium]|nr:uracil-DNA glycosylase [Lentisphaeria bacterium]